MADDRPARRAPRDGRARRPVVAAARRREPRLTRSRSRAGSVVAATGGFLGVSSTRRAAVLAVVVCALALTVSVPLRNYVAQRAELAAVTAQQQALQAEVDALAAEQSRLDDPAVVAAEARSRLGYANPGETPYVVQLPEAPAAPEMADRFRDEPWYDRLWREVRGGPSVTPEDAAAVTTQLGRAPRGVRAVAHRCPCGLPSVVQTAPRLPDGTPFPTLYYLTCARLNSRIGTLEAEGRMREMTDRLAADPALAAAYRRAHEAYLAERDALEPLGHGVSAGGMPDRVKCLHVHVAHALAAGPGVNPFGDEALAEIGEWWRTGPCVAVDRDPVEGGP